MIEVGGKVFKPGTPMVVAEISCNHMGALDLAERLIVEAQTGGADAVKFQLYEPSDMTSPSDSACYTLDSGPWAGMHLWELYDLAHTPSEWMPELFEQVRRRGMVPFCSVFGSDGIAMCEELGAELYKVASAEAGWTELIDACVATGKPVLVSNGVTQVSRTDVIEMTCVAEYPAHQSSYGFQPKRQGEESWGLSDHSMDASVWCTAASLGAEVIEAHIMLDGTHPLDEAFSLNAESLAYLGYLARQSAALAFKEQERRGNPDFARRLVFANGMKKGAVIGVGDLVALRCKEGLDPDNDMTGRSIRRNVEKHEPANWELFE